jgi:hypothetical protein
MGCVYFAKDPATGETKIGYTGDEAAGQRMGQHWTSNPRLQMILEIPTDNPSGLEAFLQAHFSQKRTSGEFFTLDESDLDEAKRLAKFFSESTPMRERVEQLKRERDNGILIDPLDSHRELVERWRAVRGEFARIKQEKELLDLELQASIGIFAGIEGLVTWKAHDHHWFDKDQLEIERPEIYANYWKLRIQRNLYLSRIPPASTGRPVIEHALDRPPSILESPSIAGN